MLAYKTELDPNDKQKTFLSRCCGASRFVFNWGLSRWKELYGSGEKPSTYSLCKEFNSIKDELCPWIRELPYAVSEGAFANLHLAYQNFFRRVKMGGKPGYPKFKKKGQNGSFHIRDTKVFCNSVSLTHIGLVKLKENSYIPIGGKYGTYATISNRAGRWYISVLVKDEKDESAQDLNGIIGVDLGLLHLATLSDGTMFENPRAMRVAQTGISRLQREMSRRKLGSSNREKTKLKLQRAFADVQHIRDFELGNIAKTIVDKKPAIIVLEDLNVNGMMKNSRLAYSISDAGMSGLRQRIENKAKEYGISIIVADQWFPSSKTCSRCGNIKSNLNLSDRVYRCPTCGLEIDRDLNAAINLAAYGERQNMAGLPVELAGSKTPL